MENSGIEIAGFQIIAREKRLPKLLIKASLLGCSIRKPVYFSLALVEISERFIVLMKIS